MLQSIAASSAHHGNLRSSQWSKPRKLNRPPFEWRTNHLLYYPFLWVIPSNLYVPVSSAGLRSWCTSLEQLFSNCHVKKTRVFLWASVRLDFTELFTFRFCIRDLKTPGKSVNFDLPNCFLPLEGVANGILPIQSKNHVFHRNLWVCIGHVWRHGWCHLAEYRVFIDQATPFIGLI